MSAWSSSIRRSISSSLARSLGVTAERAKTVHEATDLLGAGVRDGGPMLIDVELDRAFKPM